MKNCEPLDRLSELPDALIFDIFWLLPMRDVVRTTILSKRWKNLWNTVPGLNFEYEFDKPDQDIVQKFVNRALMSWRGIKILKFKINFVYTPVNCLFSDINSWVRFAIQKKVEELYVHLIEGYLCDREVYAVPQCLYSCSSLKLLSLRGCNLDTRGGVLQCNQLKSLTIDWDSSLTSNAEDVINQVLCGSPHLEVLILKFVDCNGNLSIRSSSLKRLSIKNYLNLKLDYDASELRIWTPNLETLEIRGVPYSKCLLKNVSTSLIDVTIGFYSPNVGEIHRWFNSRIRYYVRETLRQILPTIQHVDKLTLLSNSCIKVLGDMKKEHLLSPFPNVIQLDDYLEEYEEIVDLIHEMFPKVKMLVLQPEKKYYEHAKSCLKFERNLPNSFLMQLRTVEITWNGDDSIFPLIQILLKYASNLQKMVLQKRRITPRTKASVLASPKLLRIPISSPTVELILCEY